MGIDMRSLEDIEADLFKEIDRLRTKACENSLAEFTKQAWEVIEQGTVLEWNWHLDTICGYLEATTTMDPTRRITRLIINVPPGTMKSILVSVMFPAWLWIKQPHKKVVGIANIQDLSIRDARRTKQIVGDEWFQNRWPLAFKGDQSAKTNYENTSGGFRQSLGITANITGKRGNYLLLDDLHDASDVNSDVQRQGVLDIYDEKISTRLNNQHVDVIILIMQRLHHMDITGHLLGKKKTKWVHVVIPMHYDSAFTFNATKDLGRPELEDPRTKDGELLFPGMFPQDVVEKLEEDMGSHVSAGQLEQRPSVKGGGIMRQGWFRVFNKDDPLPVCDHIFISCDTAYSEKDMVNNSYSAFTTWGVFWNPAQERDCVLLLDMWYDRVDYPELRRKAHELDKDKKPDTWLIEKKASGQCHDDKTEVLTKEGWKLFKDIDISVDLFATRNIESNNFEWQQATAEVHEQYKGDMYHFKGKTHDALVTPKHRMLVNSMPRSLGGHPTKTKKLGNNIISAKVLMHKGREKTKVPMQSNWIGLHIKSKQLKADTFVKGKAGYTAKVLNVEGDDYVKFMAMYLSEGWTQQHKRNYGVHIGQYKTSKCYALYHGVSQRISGNTTKERRNKEMYISNRHLYHFVKEYGSTCDTKFIPEDIMNSSKAQCQLFWDYYVLGDGHVTKHGHQSITTTSVRMAGQLQELAQKIGYSASVALASKPKAPFHIGNNKRLTLPENLKPCYTVRLRTSKSQQMKGTKISYEGTIHCVQVPNGILYTRRNGYPLWSGNSLIQDLRQSGLMVRTYQPDKDKVTRAYSIQAMLESGQVWIPDRKWAHKFTYLMSTFPTGVIESMDLADTFTQALIYIRNGWYVTHPDDEKWAPVEVKRASPYGGHLADTSNSGGFQSIDGIDPRDLIQ